MKNDTTRSRQSGPSTLRWFACLVARAVPRLALVAALPLPHGLRADDDPVAAADRAVARAAERAAPAVVAIEVERDEAGAGKDDSPMPPVMPGGRMRSLLDFYTRPKGPVSGVVLEPDGFILTSRYNIMGSVREIWVHLGGEARKAKLLGWSELHDVALLKVEAKGLPVLQAAPPASFAAGRFCVHIGRSPTPARPTVTWGILSALKRWDDTAIQTDAKMNFGSAGGALVDIEGRLLGIATHIADRTVWGQCSGVGFATKLEKILEILPRLKAGEQIKRRIGFLGVAFDDAKQEGGGVRVARVAPDTPAAKAGLQAGDILTEFNEKPVESMDLLVEKLRATPPGMKVKIKYRRGAEEKEIEVELINKPTPD